jgi:hypothetical protein
VTQWRARIRDPGSRVRDPVAGSGRPAFLDSRIPDPGSRLRVGSLMDVIVGPFVKSRQFRGGGGIYTTCEMISVPLKLRPSYLNWRWNRARARSITVGGRRRGFGRSSGTAFALRRRYCREPEEGCLKTLGIRCPYRPKHADASTHDGTRCKRTCCVTPTTGPFTGVTSKLRCDAAGIPY